MSDICLQGRVVGKVQGVGFRQATVREASRLGISGWVRNQSGWVCSERGWVWNG